jgi:hypothetical protein
MHHQMGRCVLASTTLSAKDLEKGLKVGDHCRMRFRIAFADPYAPPVG